MKLFLNFTNEADRNANQHLFLLYNYSFTLEQDLQVLTTHPQIILICDSCERKLNHAASVLVDGEYRKDYCVTCFLKADDASQEYHYYVRPNLNVSITEEGWNVLGELLLMQALEKYGYGHWWQIKNFMDYHSQNFSSQQIEAHYNRFYLGKTLKPAFTEPSQIHKLNPYIHQPTPIKETPQVQLPEVTVRAYDTKRQEHYFDYNPEAELAICDLQFFTDDSFEVIELKMLKLQEYDKQVKERHKRQAFAVHHQLLSEERHKQLLGEGIGKNLIRKQMEGYSRFMNRSQSEKLVSSLTFQATLSATIRELSKNRKKTSFQTFEEKYKELMEKKQRRSLELGKCPVDLNPIAFTPQPNAKEKKKHYLDEAGAFQQIRQLDFIDKDAKITIIKRAQ